MNPATWHAQDWMFAFIGFAVTYGAAFARGYWVGRRQEREENQARRLKELLGRE